MLTSAQQGDAGWPKVARDCEIYFPIGYLNSTGAQITHQILSPERPNYTVTKQSEPWTGRIREAK
ncbi:hypothetical protein [Sphingobacterium sp. BS-2]|uniref:hypothetical protein n=1 Tax=Sphingobacterium sp. BS-2 TaxID=3377129 RepID=UPI0038FC6F8C